MYANIDYEKIIEAICYVKGIKRYDTLKISRNKEYKYVLFLLFKKFKCKDTESIYKDLLIPSKRAANYGLKKAEEQFFINREFREMYFEIENILEKIE
ncbi:ribose-5-phosphate isomerase [Clostridium lacusfryxellense]|uniref:ribose-5-phosphate isomerase n=1 Tax=Clostridium lacusfryxellense TaxID=205328 RepID=UPI001C0B5012|nr:ribose-5-phosphate isomerase [Clostridium lacusfryxellense]MBU3111555.1 ribose-5-phosphate isomerase [Clostridium lacusfryxellense]